MTGGSAISTCGKRVWILLCGLGLWSALPHAEPRQPTIAVWDFDNASVLSSAHLNYLRSALSEMLLNDLAQSSGIRLVERVRLREVLEEQKLGASELTSQDTRLRLGRIAGAGTMVFGSYMAMGGQIRVDVRVVDVETSLIKLTEQATGPPTSMAKEIHRIAQAIAMKLGGAPQGAEKGLGGPTDLESWKRYEQGIALMDSHKYDEAIALFQELLKSYPDFAAAERQIQLALERQARQ